MSSAKHSKRVSEAPMKKGKGRADANSMSVEERMEAERTSLVQERQAELEVVVDNHDNLIREAFHLEKFVSLLAYNPQEAKTDNSSVFRDYKANYDLLSQYAAGAGPSRRTRRAQTELSQSIKQTGIPPAKPSSKRKSAPRKNTASNVDVWSLLSQTKKKEKEKEKGRSTISSDGPPTHDLSISTSISVDRKGKAKAVSEVPLEPQNVIKDHDLSTLSEIRTTRKRRKTGLDSSIDITIIPQLPHKSTLSTPSSNLRSSRTRQSQRNRTPPLVPREDDHVKKPTPFLRKIRLIVRKPLPGFTNPHQKPHPPQFNESISSFLSSYISLHDGKDVGVSSLENLAKRDAAILEKREKLRKEGRLVLGFEGDPSQPGDAEAELRSGDAWESVVDAVVSKDRTRSNRDRHSVTSQIVTKIKGYWDDQGLKQEKLRALEEKRLKALAKDTIRLVTNEWKRAVMLIREQQRLQLEAEERLRGHMHLDAILDQSGHILEAQQIDLSRKDGRNTRGSKSLSPSLLHDLNPSETSSIGSGVEDEDLVQEEENDTEEQTEDEAGENYHDEGTLGLLDADSYMDIFASESPLSPNPSHSALALEDEQFANSPQSLFDDRPLFPPTPVVDNLEMHPKTHNHEQDDYDPASITDFFPSYQPLPEDDLASGFSGIAGPTESPDKHAPGSLTVNGTELGLSVSGLEATESPKRYSQTITDVLTSNEDIAQVPKSDSMNGHHIITELREDQDLVPSSPLTLNPVSAELLAEGVSPDLGVEIGVERSGNLHQTNEVEDDVEENTLVPRYLRPFAVTPVDWNSSNQVKSPLLLRGVLRPYQQAGLEWLASLHMNNLNGILSDEMGLGKTIQTIALLGHLACDRGIWGPHLIIVPTSVLLNWEMEFKKFLPGFQVLSYHGNTKRRKELRQGWNNKYHFNVCITSYTLASRDAHIFRRKPWYYMILDEAHMIKNFKSQRWNTLLMFKSFRRLLLTGTPLQNNLTELWALLQFLMSGTDFANLKEFGEWFAAPLEKAVESGVVSDDDTQQRVTKLHTVLRPYLLRRLKRDVEKELPSKYEHIVSCPLSKRQRFLYDEFMDRAQTRHDLQSGVYQKIANVLMQLRKVCNHPDLFEVRPIVTSFVMNRSAIADFEIKELLIRRQLLKIEDEDELNMGLLGLRFIDKQNTSWICATETKRLDGTLFLPYIHDMPGEPPPKDTRTIEGFKAQREFQRQSATIARWAQIGHLNRLRCAHLPIYSKELITMVCCLHQPLLPLSAVDVRKGHLNRVSRVHGAIKSYSLWAQEMAQILDKFAFVTPSVVANDLSRIALAGHEDNIRNMAGDITFDEVLHNASVKLQIAFPDPSLLQYDCGKLQELTRLLRERKSGGHRVLIFTQMTRILDILELFLNFHGYLYLRLDGATKIEDRQYITERFNSDSRVFCFISSSRSGGVGINLTGADTVIFYDSDFNPQMDRQCEDRAHRIGQIRDVHIYRFISQFTVEEALLRKANQKRSLDDLIIQKGEFDWRSLFGDESALNNALGEVEDVEDARAAALATKEALAMEGADEADFGAGTQVASRSAPLEDMFAEAPEEVGEEEEEEGGTCVDYMVSFVRRYEESFRDWRV